MAERRIVVNADDYGLTPGVNAGILEAIAAGVVSSVSVMVNTPGFADGMRRLGGLERPPGVGLHLNLTVGAPLSSAREVPTLVGRRGGFLGLPVLAARAVSGAVDPADVRRECEAQLARLRDAWPGPDHLDGHHHVHVLPGIREAAVSAATAADIPWVRHPAERLSFHQGALKRLTLGVLSGAAPRGRAGARPPRVAGIGLRGGPRFLTRVLALLDDLPFGVTELIVHPGHAEAALAAWDGYREQRDAELAALLSPSLRGRLAGPDPVLTAFGAL